MCPEFVTPGIIVDDQLITTDTTAIKQREGLPITVLSVAGLLGEGIKRIYDNASVTGLFKVKGY